jgi:hypothetical protein
MLVFTVRDTGPGIAARDQQRIFDEFEQASIGINRPHEGIGLGLAISKRIVEAAGGSIELASRVGEGACFTIRYPVPARNPPNGDNKVLAGRAIAILSPNTIEADMLAQSLRDAGATAEIFQDRDAAIAACKDDRAKHDADRRQPDRRRRGRFPRFRRVPGRTDRLDRGGRP